MDTGLSLLLVDDQAPFLEALTLALEAAGHRIVAATSAEAALAMLADETIEPIDLILSDILLPGIDGYTLCSRVRAHEAWAHIPFLFVSGMVLDSQQHACYARENDGYLAKPVQPEDVLATIQHLMAGQLSRSQASAAAARTAASPTVASSGSPEKPLFRV